MLGFLDALLDIMSLNGWMTSCTDFSILGNILFRTGSLTCFYRSRILKTLILLSVLIRLRILLCMQLVSVSIIIKDILPCISCICLDRVGLHLYRLIQLVHFWWVIIIILKNSVVILEFLFLGNICHLYFNLLRWLTWRQSRFEDDFLCRALLCLLLLLESYLCIWEVAYFKMFRHVQSSICLTI